MAVYDGERYLAEAIRSVLAQTFDDLELIVVDDGSTDRSASIAQGIADRRIRLLSNPTNLGLSRSLNRGVSEARGELVARLDADDVAEPQRLARQVAFLDASADVALVGSWYLELGDDGATTPRRLPVDHWDLRWHLRLTCPFVHSAVMWRRQPVADRVGAYDERLAYSMDFDLWRRITSVMHAANLPEYLVRVRTHGASMTASYGSRAREGLRMRAALAAEVLGWSGGEEGDDERRLERLYRLHVSTPREPVGRVWMRDARDLLRLHAAFVRSEGVPPRVATRQRRAIVAGIMRRLARASFARGAPRTAAQ
jgi:glycosyltransferase involved in cell wall biosynthesis